VLTTQSFVAMVGFSFMGPGLLSLFSKKHHDFRTAVAYLGVATMLLSAALLLQYIKGTTIV
jgi:hypothetical protein